MFCLHLLAHGPPRRKSQQSFAIWLDVSTSSRQDDGFRPQHDFENWQPCSNCICDIACALEFILHGSIDCMVHERLIKVNIFAKLDLKHLEA